MNKKWYLQPYWKQWFVGLNDHWKTGHVSIEEVPLVLLVSEWLIGWVCHLLHYIPFPPIPIKVSEEDWEHTEDGDGWTTMSDYWGDLGQLFCCKIHNPFMTLVYAKTLTINLELPFDILVEKFPKEYEAYKEGDEPEVREDYDSDEEWEGYLDFCKRRDAYQDVVTMEYKVLIKKCSFKSLRLALDPQSED